MKKITSLSILILTLVSGITIVSAAGSGGGGSPPPPTCQSDTWSCNDWSSCPVEGTQTRTCSLTFNCPTAETPKPAEQQSCTPACTQDTWDCTPWSACAVSGVQSRSCVLRFDCPLADTPKPTENQTCQPNCTADTWTCAAWSACSSEGKQNRACSLTFDCPSVNTAKPAVSQACTAACTQDEFTCGDWSQCQLDGKERRACTLTRDCPNITTAAPAQEQICPGLKCGQLVTIDERVRCRLQLTDAQLKAEFNILYFPEYCRVEETPDEQRACIAFYQSLGPCWELAAGSSRKICAYQTLGISSVKTEAEKCKALSGAERTLCISTLKEKVEHLILFEMYELSVQAEELLAQKRVTREAVIELEVFIETKKAQLGEQESLGAWKILIWQVKERWGAFVARAT